VNIKFIISLDFRQFLDPNLFKFSYLSPHVDSPRNQIFKKDCQQKKNSRNNQAPTARHGMDHLLAFAQGALDMFRDTAGPTR
jgi:hypothetical protein